MFSCPPFIRQSARLLQREGEWGRRARALSSKEKKERKLKKVSEFKALAEKAEIGLFAGQEPASKDERVQSE